MKNFKWAGAALAVLALFAILLKLQAQTVANPNEDAATVPTEPLVMNSADLAAVPTLSTADLAAFLSALAATPQIAYTNIGSQAGTFYSLQNPEWPPLPFDSSRSAAWPMNGFYLLSDVGFDYAAAAASFRKSSLASSAGMMSADDLTPPGDGDTNGYGGYTNSFSPLVLNSNLLYLEIASADNASGIIQASLNHSTNQVYFIESATNLATPFADWQVETEVWPTDTNSQPFTLLTQGRDNLFLRAFDATGVDSDSDGVPDFWAWTFFGSRDLPDTNLDYSGNGNTFAQDYSNNIVPTVFSFTGLEVTNNYVNVSAVPVQLDVAGKPFYLATLMDDPNFANANWQTYASSNVTVNLGLTEGWHDVWIGLRGHGDDPTNAVWQKLRLKLDFTPPALTITSPTNGTVDIPLIQLQGFCPEDLSRIRYDLTNAAGMLTNQLVLALNRHFDMTAGEFTTNTWQAFDVGLTNGVNTFTLHATDLAGNVTTTNFNVTLDYSAKTNPPALQITWPQDGMHVAGDRFTLIGQVADPTVAVTATITSTNGATNIVSGLVERDGRFWLENLPLNGGTNAVSILARDVAGNTTVSNLYLVQSELTLTLDPPGDPAQLWQPTVSVSGTVSDAGVAVWVNGVAATNHGDGTWSAANVPVTPGGVAVFQMRAQAAGQPDQDHSTSLDKPWRCYPQTYQRTWEEGQEGDGWAQLDRRTSQGALFWADADAPNWQTAGFTNQCFESGTDFDTWAYTNLILWPRGNDRNGWSETGQWPITDPSAITNYDETVPPALGEWVAAEHCVATNDDAGADWTDTWQRTAQAVWHVQTGGKAVPRRFNLWQFNASVWEVLSFNPASLREVTDKTQIGVGGMGNLFADGTRYNLLPNGADFDVTPTVAGLDYYAFSVAAQKYHPYIGLATSTTNANLDTDVPEVCVGQLATFTLNWSPSAPPIINMAGQWKLPPKFVNQQTSYSIVCMTYFENDALLQNTNQTACWFYNGSGGKVSAGMNLRMNNGQYVSASAIGSISVYRPTFSNFQNDANGFSDFPAFYSYGIPFWQGNMTWNVTLDSKYDGAFGVTQLLNSDASPYNTDGEDWLDGNSEIYGTITNGPDPYIATNNPIFHVTTLDDHPNAPASPCVTMQATFRDYLRFQPAGDGNIFVTIGTNGWHMDGAACLISGISSSNFPPASAMTNSDEFPRWARYRPGS